MSAVRNLRRLRVALQSCTDVRTTTVEIPIDLHVPRRLQELGHLKDLLLGRPLEVEELPDRRFAGVHRDELNANAVTEFFP
jgi:hypothetical protein